MAFAYKDLMVTVLRERAQFGWPGGCCVSYGHNTHCGPCGSVISCPLPTIHHLEDLVVLKEQLRVALNQVEAAEAVMREQAKPQTVAEVEALEEQLGEALGELRRQKAALQSQESGAEDSGEPTGS